MVLIIGIALASVGLKAFVHARNTPSSNACINNLRQIEGAKQQWQLETNKTNNAVATWKDIGPYLGRGVDGEILRCPKSGSYILGRANEKPRCSCGEVLPQ